MTIAPISYELLTMAVFGISGISIGLIAGIRGTFLLVPFGLLASVCIRLISSLLLGSFGIRGWMLEAWFSLSVLSVLIALPWWRKNFSDGAKAVVAWLVMLGLSALTKYGLAIGEMQHSDSASQVSIALVLLQEDNGGIAELDRPKRGLAYPLLLALGPGGRILSLITPAIFLSTIAIVIWLVEQLTTKTSRKALFLAVTVIGAFSLSVPMVRIAIFYINSHTLMGLAIAAMAAGLLLVRHNPSAPKEAFWLLALGSLVGSTTRIEGILLVALFVLLLASQVPAVPRGRILPSAVALISGLGLSWWLWVTRDTITSEFGLELWMLPIMVLAGATLIGLTVIDPIRKWLPHTAAIVLLALLAREIWTSSDPWAAVMTQWPNLVLGEGGWGTAAILYVGFTFLYGWKNQNVDYRWLQSIIWLAIAVIFFSKTFDGGFGRESFYDSVNRMLLHVMPLILTVSVVGLAGILSRFESARKQRSKPKSVSQT
jgi:hypothetical protein